MDDQEFTKRIREIAARHKSEEQEAMAAEKAFHDARIQYHETFRLLKESAIMPTVMSAARLLTESGMRAQGTAFDPQTESAYIALLQIPGTPHLCFGLGKNGVEVYELVGERGPTVVKTIALDDVTGERVQEEILAFVERYSLA